MTSWTRNAHMPSVDASRCCSASSKWWATWTAWVAAASAKGGIPPMGGWSLSELLVVVGFAGDHGRAGEVLRRRGGRGLPFEARRPPGVGGRDLPVPHRPDE